MRSFFSSIEKPNASQVILFVVWTMIGIVADIVKWKVVRTVSIPLLLIFIETVVNSTFCFILLYVIPRFKNRKGGSFLTLNYLIKGVVCLFPASISITAMHLSGWAALRNVPIVMVLTLKMFSPFFSMFFVYVLYKQRFSLLSWLSLLIIIFGSYFVIFSKHDHVKKNHPSSASTTTPTSTTTTSTTTTTRSSNADPYSNFYFIWSIICAISSSGFSALESIFTKNGINNFKAKQSLNSATLPQNNNEIRDYSGGSREAHLKKLQKSYKESKPSLNLKKGLETNLMISLGSLLLVTPFYLLFEAKYDAGIISEMDPTKREQFYKFIVSMVIISFCRFQISLLIISSVQPVSFEVIKILKRVVIISATALLLHQKFTFKIFFGIVIVSIGSFVYSKSKKLSEKSKKIDIKLKKLANNNQNSLMKNWANISFRFRVAAILSFCFLVAYIFVISSFSKKIDNLKNQNVIKEIK
ncbi:solute carrier family 35 [Anaeramoeba flamelloides]|uniref:Solute carrier family 35 n=1 Tax=Anaeramoeba flamelloides TaxID=1746091 RepID=A0ABQ8Z248_9EUKA|nr:solute carrier family 35 [Anaeramoeba flamelloides]